MKKLLPNALFIGFTGTPLLKKDKKTYLLIPVVGYLIQAFFNISVIEVAPMFYMALGLCINKDNAKLLK